MLKIVWSFDKQTEELILQTIRERIYSKYPKRSLKTSSLISNFSLQVRDNHVALGTGIGKLNYLFLQNRKYDLYYKDELIKQLDYNPIIRASLKWGRKSQRG